MNNRERKKRGNFGILALLIISIVGLDQISKILVVRYISEGFIIPIVDGFFNLTLTYNKGAAFGFLGAIENDILRISLLWSATGFALIAVIYMFLYEYKNSNLARLGLTLVMGGAIGNCIDRASLGRVVDFIDIYYKSYHWPAFNIADSAICLGVLILLLSPGSKTKQKKGEEVPSISVKNSEAKISEIKVSKKPNIDDQSSIDDEKLEKATMLKNNDFDKESNL